MKTALITGINGQDGSYLAELLLKKGYQVHGTVRREAFESKGHRLVNISHLVEEINLHVCAIDNQLVIHDLISQIKPDECYHLAASSFVSYKLDDEASVLATNFNSTLYLLSSIKKLVPDCKFYFAGSSEMFGEPNISPQTENTSYAPRSIYGISKVASKHLVDNYRRNENIFACTGIMYNHESPRRHFQFVTRKVTSTVAKIYLGLENSLELGNLTAKRDWGYAPDYVKAMWGMLNQDTPDDYVIATQKLHSVQELVELAFSAVDLDYKKYLKINPQYYRADNEVPLVGDTTKAQNKLNWKPTKSFADMIFEMVHSDIALLKKST